MGKVSAGLIEEPQGSDADSEEKPAVRRVPTTRSTRAKDRATIFPVIPPPSGQTQRRNLKPRRQVAQLKEEVQSDDQILIHSGRPTLGAAKRLSLESDLA